MLGSDPNWRIGAWQLSRAQPQKGAVGDSGGAPSPEAGPRPVTGSHSQAWDMHVAQAWRANVGAASVEVPG
jgi:hypothetical protein